MGQGSGTSVLVTGGAGFIGSRLSERLLQRGYRVRILDNLSYGKREWVPKQAEFVEGDIRDLATCQAAVAGMTGVFHAAAMSRAAPSNDAVSDCVTQNVVGTANVLMAARDAGVRKLVYSGSSTFYGSQPPPHREDTPADIGTFYGLTKEMGERLAMMFNQVSGLPVVVLRYFNVYGPRQPRSGAYALVLGIFLDRASRGEPLEIHGSGEQRRDFVHVDDVADANVAAFESTYDREVFNVGSGVNYSIKEIADMISPNQVAGPRRTGDAEVTLADIGKATALLGWSPKVSFEAGLRGLRGEYGLQPTAV